MICIRTTDDWQAATIDVDDGMGAQTWTPSAGVSDAYSAAVDLAAWIDATFADTTTTTFSRGGDLPKIDIEPGASYTFTATAAAQSLYGMDPNGSTPIQWASPAGAVAATEADGTTGCRMSTAARDPTKQPRPSASVGAPSIDPPGQRGEVARLVMPLSATAVAVMRTALLVAANPRTAYVYDATAATWRDVVLPAVDFRGTPPLVVASAEVVL